MKTKQITFNRIEYFFDRSKIPEFVFEDDQLTHVNFDLAHKVDGPIDNKVNSQHGYDWVEVR
ncbi:hypothetical protein MJH12_08640 [bacterium]|nr:hypothetical protein [bacterium]